MREELIKLLQERVGLSQAQAEQATDVVLKYLQEKGPQELQSLLGGKGGLGGIFGR